MASGNFNSQEQNKSLINFMNYTNSSIERYFKHLRDENEKKQQNNSKETVFFHSQEQEKPLNNYMDFSNNSIERNFKQLREENEKKQQTDLIKVGSFHSQEKNTVTQALVPETNYIYYGDTGKNIQQKSNRTITFQSNMDFSNGAIEGHFKNLRIENERKPNGEKKPY